jgi:hypothetical protein
LDQRAVHLVVAADAHHAAAELTRQSLTEAFVPTAVADHAVVIVVTSMIAILAADEAAALQGHVG